MKSLMRNIENFPFFVEGCVNEHFQMHGFFSLKEYDGVVTYHMWPPLLNTACLSTLDFGLFQIVDQVTRKRCQDLVLEFYVAVSDCFSVC